MKRSSKSLVPHCLHSIIVFPGDRFKAVSNYSCIRIRFYHSSEISSQRFPRVIELFECTKLRYNMITATLARLMRHPPGPPLLAAAPPTQADQRMSCNTCSSTSFRPLSASIESCSCSQTLEVSYNSPATQSVVRSCDYVMDQLQDWEFAGDEEIRDINHEDGHVQDSTLLRL